MDNFRSFLKTLNLDFDILINMFNEVEKSNFSIIHYMSKLTDFLRITRWMMSDILRVIQTIHNKDDYQVDFEILEKEVSFLVETLNLGFLAMQKKKGELWKICQEKIPIIDKLLVH